MKKTFFFNLLVRADLWADKLAIIINVHEYITKLQLTLFFKQSRSSINNNYLLFTRFHVKDNITQNYEM